jgi:O-succinylbenzoate synthase
MLTLTYQRRALHFNFPARTSRGALTEHVAYYLGLRDARRPQVVGWGEAAPLAGLSPDYGPSFERTVADFCQQFNQAGHAALAVAEAAALVPATLPSLRFALETAVLDLDGGGQQQLYTNAFSQGDAGLPINGLVWMGDAAFMREQIRQKLAAGYACLKVKIGSLDFAAELELLTEIRAEAGPNLGFIRLSSLLRPDNGRRWRRCAVRRRCPLPWMRSLSASPTPASRKSCWTPCARPTSCSSPRCWGGTPPPAVG